jgi:antitoxin component of RelBE/YafQ-DinJ toxin-antitoxin module
MVAQKIYLDEELKSVTKEIFKSYGLSFSDGLNFLLKQVMDKKTPILSDNLQIETIPHNDPDYALMQSTVGEKSYSLDEVMKEFE